jgi:Tfp pilus assembly protein PilN
VRPINLIPPEDRRGDQAPLRTGPLVYVLLGALVAVLVAVTSMVLVNNQVAEREAEVTKLEREDADAAARAAELASYTEFQAMSEARVTTVSSLADSRFDWERVMRELSLVLPGDVWLVGLDATASSDVSVEGGGGGSLRGSVPGPALELTGCATGQEAVAGFVTALKDIDGVTRVGIEFSELGKEKDSSASEGESVEVGAAQANSGENCQTREFIAKFSIVVAFDAAPVVDSESGGEEAAPPAEGEAQETSSEGTEGG